MEDCKFIHLKEPNTLSLFLTKEERQTIKSLKITGYIGDEDFFEVLDDMCTAWGEYDDDDNFIVDYEETPALRHLDMGEAQLAGCEGLSELGYHAPLETLILPQGVKTLGFEFFSESENLRTLELPKGLRNVSGFMSCPNLTNLTLPEGLEEIHSYAFAGCTAITAIRIPASVKVFDGSCFASCNIKAYEIDKDNPYFTAIDGVVYSKNLSTLVAFPSAYPAKHFVIPDTTRKIGVSAFDGSRIESVEFPVGISIIEDWAFTGSTIRCIDLPNSVTSIGKGAFRHCWQLEHIRLPNRLEEIPTQLFSSCPKLKIIDVPSNVRKLYYSAVAWSRGLEQLLLHDGLEEIVDEGPMLGCGGNLQELVFPKTLRKVQGGLFNYSSLIKSYHVAPDNSYFCVIDGALYSKDRKILYAVPDPERSDFTIAEGTEVIAEKAFFGLSKLETVTMSNSLHEIGDRAFQDCCQLKSIRLPENVTSIGAYFLLSCDKIESITIDAKIPPQMTGHVREDMWEFRKVKLLVPKGCSILYKNAPGWNCFIISEQ